MKNLKITIIGGGNLGSAIAKGMINSNQFEPSNIVVTRRRLELIAHLADKGISLERDNTKVVQQADIVMLAVKPYQLEAILKEITDHIKDNCIIVSFVTGVNSTQILETLGKDLPVFRAMPNTAISIVESMTCISSHGATPEQEQLVLNIFDQMGNAVLVMEEMMAGATVLAACGIAYAMRFIRAATQGGIEIGFSSKMALQIVSQTVKGAAELIIKEGNHPEAEIDSVATPRGITISGLNEMEHNGFSSSLIKGITTSFNKIEGSK